MKSYSFLFWGYLVVWVALAVYLVALMRRVSQVSRRVDALEAGRAKRDAGRAT
jgi:CcmD family protein